MQWTAGENAGFTTATPWLPVNENQTSVNVEAALSDPDSIFYYYQKLVALRKSHSVFRGGRFTLLLPEDEQRFVCCRDTDTEHMLVIYNFSAESVSAGDIPLPENAYLLSNYSYQTACLQPWEARLYLWEE